MCKTKTRVEVCEQAHMGWIQSLGMDIVPDKELYDISCPLELGCTKSRCVKNSSKLSQSNEIYVVLQKINK